jgi:hypothetical protein
MGIKKLLPEIWTEVISSCFSDKAVMADFIASNK